MVRTFAASLPTFAFSIEPTVEKLIFQLLAVVGALQGVFFTLPSVLIPMHTFVLNHLGPRAAMCSLGWFIIVVGHLWGTLLTMPALYGVKFGKIQVNKVASVSQLKKDLPQIGINLCISLFLGGFHMAFLVSDKIQHDIMADFPNSQTVLCHSLVFFFVTEAHFYYSHRLLHENKYLYAKIHKLHHTWPAPVALVATFAHPLEHIVGNLGSVAAGPMVCGSHPIVGLAWMLLAQIHTYSVHSGYWGDDMGMHDLHHEIFNANYGTNGLFDLLHGTYRTKSMRDLVALHRGSKTSQDEKSK
jgi:sterol desaturase/sphingolipid hydroxylase (fatty acid hydroxylase superfamily)